MVQSRSRMLPNSSFHPRTYLSCFYRNTKVYLETSRFLSKPTTSTLFLFIYSNRLTSFVSIEIGKCQPEMTMSKSNHLTSFVPIKIGECQLEMTMSYSNHLTSFVSIEIGERQLEMNTSVFLLSFVCSLLVFFSFYQIYHN